MKITKTYLSGCIWCNAKGFVLNKGHCFNCGKLWNIEQKDKDFKCDKCGKEFDTLDGLAWHKTYKGQCPKKMIQSPAPHQTDDDFPEIDFRKDIANELSRDELIDRLCEMNKSYTNMRKEWFDKVHLETPQTIIMPSDSEINKAGRNHSPCDDRWKGFDEGAKWALSQVKAIDLREELEKFSDFKDTMKKVYDLTEKNFVIDKYLTQK